MPDSPLFGEFHTPALVLLPARFDTSQTTTSHDTAVVAVRRPFDIQLPLTRLSAARCLAERVELHDLFAGAVVRVEHAAVAGAITYIAVVLLLSPRAVPVWPI